MLSEQSRLGTASGSNVASTLLSEEKRFVFTKNVTHDTAELFDAQFEGAPVIEAQSVCVRYPRTAEAAITNLSVQLGNGITAIVGRNGSGKSTLMNAIVMLRKISAGRLRVLGEDLSPLPREQARHKLMMKIGYLPQEFGYIPGFTVKEFVQYAAWLKKVTRKTLPQAIKNALAITDLTSRAETKLSKLSGGMLRRAGIATAIVHNPQLVILDEPTVGLDPEQRIRFRETLRTISSNRCVLISSHLIEDVHAVADRVLILDSGEVIFTGTVAQMQQHASATAEGDTVLERAYTTLISRAHRAATTC